MGRKKKVVEPVELEVMPVRETDLKRFIVTAFITMPADHLTEEPDIREEIEACNGSAASSRIMRQHGRPSYYYLTVTDITPAKKRQREGEA